MNLRRFVGQELAISVTGKVTGSPHQKLPLVPERMSPVAPVASMKVIAAPTTGAPPLADEYSVPDR
jgi:hypothetical protein